MRIAAISNFYPPVNIGGYELLCQDLLEALRRRGHLIEVLTSSYKAEQAAREPGVSRVLPWFSPFSATRPGPLSRWSHEARSLRCIEEFLTPGRFDLVYVFGADHICRSILFAAQKRGAPVFYYVSDYWLESWREKDDWIRWWSSPDHPGAAWKRSIAGVLRRLGGRLPRAVVGLTRFDTLDLSRAQFTSAALRDSAVSAGEPVADAVVIPAGIVLERHPQRALLEAPATRLLYVGRMVRDKGVDTVVGALARLAKRRPELDYRLSIVASGDDPEYAREVERQAAEGGVAERVRFVGRVPREELAAVIRDHEVLVFPSRWQEPFGLIVAQAMASGVPVVSSATGGSGEITTDGVTGLHFTAGDEAGCADAIERLRSTELARRLQRAGRASVEERFSIERMADAVEQDFAARGAAGP